MAKTVVSCLMRKTIELRIEMIQPMAKQIIQPRMRVFREHLPVLKSFFRAW
jgi:hypothetical protein